MITEAEERVKERFLSAETDEFCQVSLGKLLHNIHEMDEEALLKDRMRLTVLLTAINQELADRGSDKFATPKAITRQVGRHVIEKTY